MKMNSVKNHDIFSVIKVDKLIENFRIYKASSKAKGCGQK